MRKRFRAGHVFQRGKRCKVWVGCYRERVLDGGQLKVQQRKVVAGSAFGDDPRLRRKESCSISSAE